MGSSGLDVNDLVANLPPTRAEDLKVHHIVPFLGQWVFMIRSYHDAGLSDDTTVGRLMGGNEDDGIWEFFFEGTSAIKTSAQVTIEIALVNPWQ